KGQKNWMDFDVEFGHLLRAMEVRCGADAAGFSADLLARLLAFSGFLTLRMQLQAGRLIAAHDGSHRMHIPGELDRELTDLIIPRVLEMQRHVAELAVTQAATARAWALAEGKQYENLMAAAPCRRVRRPPGRRGRTTPPKEGLNMEPPRQRRRGATAAS